MAAAGHGLVASEADGDVGADHVPGDGRLVPLGCCVSSAPARLRGVPGALIGILRERAREAVYIGSVGVRGDHGSAVALGDAVG